MNEQYLHFLWDRKILPFHLLKLTNGKEINVVDPGKHNTNESGPDFFMSKIKTEDNILWVGSVEMHVSSSDWYKHRHHLDEAYTNVILHVVYHHDKTVEVKGRELPVLELKSYIDNDHLLKYLRLKNKSNSFPCGKLIKQLQNPYLDQMKEFALFQRQKRKVKEINTLKFDTPEKVMYLLTAKAFGTKVNQQPFEQLANMYASEWIASLKEEKMITEFITEVTQSNPFFLWKRKGLHHFSSPKKRLREWIVFTSLLDFSYPFWELPPSMIYEYFKAKFSLAKITGKIIPLSFMVNAVSIFLSWKGLQEDDENLKEKAFKILELLPAEMNQITKKWKDLGIISQNAKDTQALLEIYHQFCRRKRCLECTVGINFLNS